MAEDGGRGTWGGDIRSKRQMLLGGLTYPWQRTDLCTLEVLAMHRMEKSAVSASIMMFFVTSSRLSCLESSGASFSLRVGSNFRSSPHHIRIPSFLSILLSSFHYLMSVGRWVTVTYNCHLDNWISQVGCGMVLYLTVDCDWGTKFSWLDWRLIDEWEKRRGLSGIERLHFSVWEAAGGRYEGRVVEQCTV